MAPSRLLVASVTLAALSFTACANNDASRSDIVNAMTDADLTDDQATCIADAMIDRFDQGTRNDIAGASEPDEFPEGTEGPIEEILTGCITEGEAPAEGEGEGGGTEGTGTTEGSGDSGSTATTEGSADTEAPGGTATTATTATTG